MNSHRARAFLKKGKGTNAWETTQHEGCLNYTRLAAAPTILLNVSSSYKEKKTLWFGTP